MSILRTRSERAVVRPFVGIDEADKPFEEVSLLFDGLRFAPGAVVVPAHQLEDARIALRLPAPETVRAAIDRTKVPRVDCGFVVLGASRTHRASTIYYQEYLRLADWPTELVIPREADDLVLNDRAGFTLTVAVVLMRDAVPEPLRPSLAGTWLARRDFRISPELDESVFSPEELTAEVRKYHGLPEDTYSFIHVEDVLDAESLADCVRVYLDHRAMTLLQANPDDTIAVHLQIELAIQAAEAITREIARELRAADEGRMEFGVVDLEPASPALTFLERLAVQTNLKVSDLLDMAQNGASLFRANLEATFGARDAILDILRGG